MRRLARLLHHTVVDDSLLEGMGFEPSVPLKAARALGYSLLIMKSLSAPDSAPQTSPLRPASCRTLASRSGSGTDSNFSVVGSKRKIAFAPQSLTHTASVSST